MAQYFPFFERYAQLVVCKEVGIRFDQKEISYQEMKVFSIIAEVVHEKIAKGLKDDR